MINYLSILTFKYHNCIVAKTSFWYSSRVAMIFRPSTKSIAVKNKDSFALKTSQSTAKSHKTWEKSKIYKNRKRYKVHPYLRSSKSPQGFWQQTKHLQILFDRGHTWLSLYLHAFRISLWWKVPSKGVCASSQLSKLEIIQLNWFTQISRIILIAFLVIHE